PRGSDPGRSDTTEVALRVDPSTGSMPVPVTPDADPAASRPPARAAAAVRPSPLRRAAPVIGRIAFAVGGTALAFVLAVLAVLLLEGGDALVFTPTEVVFTAVGLLAISVGLGFLWRRIPELLAVSVAVILVLSFAAWLRPPLRGGFGDRQVRPANAGQLDRSYELAAGRLRLDLTGVRPGARGRSVSASVALGLVRIVVPADVTVHFDGKVEGGQICAFGHRDAGTDTRVRETSTRPGSAGVLEVKARVGVGEIRVGRSEAATLLPCG
ncbi:MAG: hypothetical protein JWL73_2571, partial [Actinomycetia bacterium]|nr:hypothetical protein [Actinomycetes bacterium]